MAQPSSGTGSLPASRQFDQAVGDLTASLGDPTRRGIYLAVREASAPPTASGVADLFDIHPNVARHHLDRLVTDGYLETIHPEAATSAGRPARRYVSTAKGVDVRFPMLRLELLVELLVRVAHRLDDGTASEVARAVGREFGQELAAQVGTPSEAGYQAAVQAVARAMTSVGFVMVADTDNERLVTSHCPFGDAATAHPEIVCSLDQGLVAGLLTASGAGTDPVVQPHTRPGDSCVTHVPVQIR